MTEELKTESPTRDLDDLTKKIDELTTEINKLQASLQDKEKQLKIAQGDKVERRVKLIDKLLENSKEVVCSCRGKAVNQYIQCLKHPSRYYRNTGCYYCCYTDCSVFRC